MLCASIVVATYVWKNMSFVTRTTFATRSARILKWPTNLAQGPFLHGLGHAWKGGKQQKGQTLGNEHLLVKPFSWTLLHFNARENILTK
jgi:hypothetical protein